MFKLVVLSALVAIVAAKPGLLHAPLAYSAIAGPSVAVPAAVSHQYRTDVVSKPVVATYAHTPVVAAAPAVVAAPLVQRTIVAAAPVSAAYTHQSRVDLHSGLVAAPVAAYAHAPVAAYAAHVPAIHAW